jgi:hypothetical protein
MRVLLLCFLIILSCDSLFARSSLCTQLEAIHDKKDLAEVISHLAQKQFAQFKSLSDRHEMGKSLNQCRPKAEAKLLVISFEGTGAYEPRVPAIFKDLHNCDYDFLDEKLVDKIYHHVLYQTAKLEKKNLKWSALEAGIFSQFLQQRELRAEQVNWVTFPSEEAEFLNGDFDYTKLSFSNLKKEIADAYNSKPRGIQNALECFETYQREAQKLKIDPRVIIVSHSSGGRSAVKFLERVKKHPIDLVFSIDPVKEAHEALLEVVEQYLMIPGKKFANLFLPKKYEIPLPPINIWSRSQPHSLYKTSNSLRWINFYQNRDSEGLKMAGLKYGIHGSPVEGAENYYLSSSLGSSAHGEIGYHPQVLARFSKEIELLFH